MAKAKRRDCYVYVIRDRAEIVYVGKGTGRRLQQQERRFGLSGSILEDGLSDEEAFKRERHWIAQLMPTANISPGGNGGRSVAKPKPRMMKEFREIERVGSRRYAARMLLRFDLSGLVDPSKLEMIRQVANGPRL